MRPTRKVDADESEEDEESSSEKEPVEDEESDDDGSGSSDNDGTLSSPSARTRSKGNKKKRRRRGGGGGKKNNQPKPGSRKRGGGDNPEGVKKKLQRPHGRRLSMNEVTGFIDLTQSSVAARNKTQSALMKSVANDIANAVKELFEKKGLSKLTTETEMTAAVIWCAKASKNEDIIMNAMQTEPQGKFLLGIKQRMVKCLSIKDRTLRYKVWRCANLIIEQAGFTQRLYDRVDIDNALEMLDFVGQAGVQKLAGALQSNVRESEAATLFLHEVAVSVLDDFTGLGPLCESVSSGLEAVVRTNIWGFLKGRTYSASVENSLLPERNSQGRETNVRTAGVDPTWLQMLTRMKSQVAGERKGDLAMDTTVARIYAQKLNAQEENPTVVDDSQNQGVSALSSEVAAMLESFDE